MTVLLFKISATAIVLFFAFVFFQFGIDEYCPPDKRGIFNKWIEVFGVSSFVIGVVSCAGWFMSLVWMDL